MNKHKRSERNVINADEAKQWCVDLTQELALDTVSDAAKWLQTVVPNYLVSQYPRTRPVVPASQRTLYTLMNRTLAQKNLAMPEVDFEPVQKRAWLEEAFERGDNVVRVVLDDALHTQVTHLVDYINSRNWTDVTRASYDQVTNSAHEWVMSLIKQRVIENDRKHVRVLHEAVIDGKKYSLVELITKSAYARESKLMKNCVDSYFNKLSHDELKLRLDYEKTISEDDELRKLETLSKELTLSHKAANVLDDEDYEEVAAADDEEIAYDGPARGYSKKKLNLQTTAQLHDQFYGIWSLRDENNNPILTCEIKRAWFEADYIKHVDPIIGKKTHRASLWYSPQIRAACNKSATSEQLNVLHQMWQHLGVTQCGVHAARSFMASQPTLFEHAARTGKNAMLQSLLHDLVNPPVITDWPPEHKQTREAKQRQQRTERSIYTNRLLPTDEECLEDKDDIEDDDEGEF